MSSPARDTGSGRNEGSSGRLELTLPRVEEVVSVAPPYSSPESLRPGRFCSQAGMGVFSGRQSLSWLLLRHLLCSNGREWHPLLENARAGGPGDWGDRRGASKSSIRLSTEMSAPYCASCRFWGMGGRLAPLPHAPWSLKTSIRPLSSLLQTRHTEPILPQTPQNIHSVLCGVCFQPRLCAPTGGVRGPVYSALSESRTDPLVLISQRASMSSQAPATM